MDSALSQFEKRKKTLRRKHERMARGYRNKLDRNGVILQMPDNKAPGMTLRLLLLVALAFIGFKTFLLAGLGEEDYLSRVAQLESGNGFEQAGAIAMRIDPATALLAERLAPLLD